MFLYCCVFGDAVGVRKDSLWTCSRCPRCTTKQSIQIITGGFPEEILHISAFFPLRLQCQGSMSRRGEARSGCSSGLQTRLCLSRPRRSRAGTCGRSTVGQRSRGDAGNERGRAPRRAGGAAPRPGSGRWGRGLRCTLPAGPGSERS